MASQKRILVTGATGNQGGGVVRECIKQGHGVIAYVRNVKSASAQELEALGASLAQGDYENVDALRSAAQHVDAVFHVQALTGDFENDLRRTKNVIDAARASQAVTTMIVSTATKTGQHESFPGWGPDYPTRQYWLSKDAVEEHVRSAGFDYWTIVRPAHFLQNLKPPTRNFIFPGFVDDLTLRVAWKPDNRLAWIDSADVGIVAAAAVSNPEKYAGRAIELASEALTVGQLAAKLSRVLGAEVNVHYYTPEEEKELEGNSRVLGSQRWANDVPGADAAEAAKEFELTSVDEFLERNAAAIRGNAE